jgi:hypothetical protein
MPYRRCLAMPQVTAVDDQFGTHRLSRTLFSTMSMPMEYIDPGPVARLAEAAWSSYQKGDLGQVVTALPGLIKTTQQMEAASTDDAAYRRSCAAVSARVHHLAATTLSKIGEADLAWIAAERAMQAADDADDPLVLASAARSGTHALLAVGRFEDALELGEVAARWLRPRMGTGDPAALSLYGMLYLRTAVAAARHQDRSMAHGLLTQAGRAADQLGVDANYWQTGLVRPMWNYIASLRAMSDNAVPTPVRSGSARDPVRSVKDAADGVF